MGIIMMRRRGQNQCGCITLSLHKEERQEGKRLVGEKEQQKN